MVTACSLPGNNGAEQKVTVTRGDINVLVTGSGSLATQQEARLSFKTAGRIEKVDCKEGDTVTQGAMLVSLETDSLALAKKQAQVDMIKSETGLAEAETGLADARLAYQTAKNNFDGADNTEETLRLAVVNAKIALEQARKTLNTAIAATDFDAVDAQLNKAKTWYDYLNDLGPDSSIYDADSYLLALENAKEKLDAAQANYDNTLAGYDTQQINIKKNQVKAAELALSSAEYNLGNHANKVTLQELTVTATQNAIVQAEQGVAYAEQAVELARQSLEYAEKNLKDAVLTAPFNGIIASVPVKEGDIIDAGTLGVRLVMPTELELIVEVDEIDVAGVRPGQDVLISVDAFPDDEYTGTVAAVYPVPTKSTGLVMYNVNLAFRVPEDSGLKIGMRATASIIVDKATDVIIVPKKAVKADEQDNYYVNVVSGKKVEQRPVTTGLSDDTNTEVITGLNEGETVSIQ